MTKLILPDQIPLVSNVRLPAGLLKRQPTDEFVASWTKQLREGCELADAVGPGLTWMGSARIDDKHWSGYYERAADLVQDIHERLKKHGLALPGYHGGGPGLMDAVAKALQAAGVPSVGLCLSLEALADGSGRIDVRLEFDDFGPRLAIFKRYSVAVFFLPGGAGTGHEGLDFIDNIAKAKMANVPCFFIEFDDDHPYWPGILHGFKDEEGSMKRFGTVGHKETSLMNIIHARDVYDRLLQRWEIMAEKERVLAANH